MPDQAERLRARIRGEVASGSGDPPRRRCRLVLLTAGKGGVGTSALALNLAVTLGLRRERVILVDADLGTANIDLLAGLAPRLDLGDVLAGECALLDAAVPGPGGIRVVAGAHAARLPGGRLSHVADRLRGEVANLRDGPDLDADLIVIDAGSGLRSTTTHLASLADEVIVVAGPEPTAILDTHAALARLGRLPPAPRVGVVVNRARSRAEGRAVLDRLAPAARQFQGLLVQRLGVVREDPRVGRAVRLGRPMVGAAWPGRATRDLGKLADALAARMQVDAPTAGHAETERAPRGTLLGRWARSRGAAM